MIMLSKKIALLAANPAFGAIVGSGLQNDARLKVYTFQTIEAITTFIQISPIDMVILDADSLPSELTPTVAALRDHPSRAQQDLAIMLLTRAAPAFHEALLAQGIDIIHGKPVAPVRLLESVRSQLHMRVAGPIVDGVYRGPERRHRGVNRVAPVAVRHDNVIQLLRLTGGLLKR